MGAGGINGGRGLGSKASTTLLRKVRSVTRSKRVFGSLDAFSFLPFPMVGGEEGRVGWSLNAGRAGRHLKLLEESFISTRLFGTEPFLFLP